MSECELYRRDECPVTQFRNDIIGLRSQKELLAAVIKKKDEEYAQLRDVIRAAVGLLEEESVRALLKKALGEKG